MTKQFLKLSQFLVITLLVLVSCKKEDEIMPISSELKQKITVQLDYLDLQSNMTSIEVLPEHIISVEKKVESTCGCGHIDYRYNIVSKHENIQLSYGILPKVGYDTFLKYGDKINDSITWVSSFTNGGDLEIGYRCEYVGMKIIEDGKTMFGWIHTPTFNGMTEFAIDTTGTLPFVIAGEKSVTY